MIHKLSAHQDVKKLLKSLTKSIGRPVYLCSTGFHSHGTVAKRPGEDSYRSLGSLEHYLSGWELGSCVKREDFEDKPSLFYFDLTVSHVMRFVFPLKKGETGSEFKDSFSGIFPYAYLDKHQEFPNVWADPVPPELKRYVQELRDSRRRVRDGIIFAQSPWVYNPAVLQPEWAIGTKVENPYHTVHTIQPPGWYSQESVTVLEEFNQTVVMETSPGPCIVCTGASKERKHIAFLTTGGGETSPRGAICLSCAPKAFESWLEIAKKA